MTSRALRARLATASLLVIAVCAACARPAARDVPPAAGAPAGAVAARALPPRAEQASGVRALLIAVSPVNEQVVWASGATGTWLRSTSGGATWVSGRVAGADSLQFRDVHGVDSLTAYLLSIGNAAQSRIYKTTDGGSSWRVQHTNPDSAGFYDCMDFWDARRGLFVGDAVDGRIVIRTTMDGGETWERVQNAVLPPAQPGEGSFAASGTCVETARGGHAWVVMNAGARARLLRTSDYGHSWATETLPITARDGSGVQSVSFRDARNGVVFGGGYQAQPTDVLIATTSDGGDTWTPRNAPAFRVGTWGGAFVPGAELPTIVASGPNGSAWARVPSGREPLVWVPIDTANYWSVGVASPRAGWAVGTQGRITRLAIPPR